MKLSIRLKLLFISIMLLLSIKHLCAQISNWTWVNGDSTINSKGVYGIKGISSPANKPPAREAAVSWTDKSGNLWLFGGRALDSLSNRYFFNDLWKFNVTSKQWTWINGDSSVPHAGVYGIRNVASPANKPGARSECIGWTDTVGNLWLFGGLGYSLNGNGHFNDLWKFNTITNQWTWVKGDSIINTTAKYGVKGVSSVSNNPSARLNTISWTDASGNFWMFGGSGYVANGYGYLNDLWKFSPLTNEWTWINGDTIKDVASTYGMQATFSAANKPGARFSSVTWKDASGNLWLFGGFGSVKANVYEAFNDLWKYNISTNEWAWVKGDSIPDIKGIYGTQNIPAIANKPGARLESISWSDASGNLWMFGGAGYSTNGFGTLNDLWMYNPPTNEWTWMKGNTTKNSKGIYDTMDVASSAAMPGSRDLCVKWVDMAGNFWMFGGTGYDATSPGQLNDLWKITPAIILSTQLFSFTAKLQEGKIKLDWLVENEQNLSLYTIEKSTDGKKFFIVGSKKPVNAKLYSYIDSSITESPTVNNQNSITAYPYLYYRLKLLDKDGRFSYSNIVSVKLPSKNSFTIFPNPATKNFQLQFNVPLNGKVTVQIIGLNGTTILQKSYEANNSTIFMFDKILPAGLYNVKVISNESQFVKRIIIAN